MTTKLILSPSRRGAADRADESILGLLETSRALRIASQQVSDPRVIEAIWKAELDSTPDVLIEGQYLRSLPALQDPWAGEDDLEPHRMALSALFRLGCDVRTDNRAGLQHVNSVLGTGLTGPRALVTSANLSPGSLSQHFNWGLSSGSEALVSALAQFYDDVWAATPTAATVERELPLDAETNVALSGGVDGEASRLAEADISAARSTIHFAFFNLVRASRVSRALVQAAQRGVSVIGFVDGDQGYQGWNGVPELREAGVQVGYYPGALTGAGGRRMHYKMLAIDHQVAHLTTANGSASAETSLELALSLRSRNGPSPFGEKVAREVNRLSPRTTLEPPLRQ